jgi:hypothetical protein
MTTTELENAKRGKYRVKFKGGRMATRHYFGTELRFGSILCGIFSTALRKGCYGMGGEWSSPHFDIDKMELIKTA